MIVYGKRQVSDQLSLEGCFPTNCGASASRSMWQTTNRFWLPLRGLYAKWKGGFRPDAVGVNRSTSANLHRVR